MKKADRDGLHSLPSRHSRTGHRHDTEHDRVCERGKHHAAGLAGVRVARGQSPFPGNRRAPARRTAHAGTRGARTDRGAAVARQGGCHAALPRAPGGGRPAAGPAHRRAARAGRAGIEGALPAARHRLRRAAGLARPAGEAGTRQAGVGEAALPLLERTLDEFIAGREREGEKLALALRERLDAVERIVAGIRAMLPEIRAALRTKLETRLAELKQSAGHQGYDPGRLEQELVLQLSRIDVDEELDRLAAHVGEARRILELDEPVGRRLDFLMQEFNREANTLGSKSADPRTTREVVDLKVLIEQMREQVQNLE